MNQKVRAKDNDKNRVLITEYRDFPSDPKLESTGFKLYIKLETRCTNSYTSGAPRPGLRDQTKTVSLTFPRLQEGIGQIEGPRQEEMLEVGQPGRDQDMSGLSPSV